MSGDAVSAARPLDVKRLLPETDVLLRWAHLPDCGETAEFPWDCTCDWKGSFEQAKRAVNAHDALVAALRALVYDIESRDLPRWVAHPSYTQARALLRALDGAKP